jgi:hypothetical protein
MDLPLAGGVSTWSNSMSWSRLDRFLVSPEWELSFPGLIQKKLLRVCSDHTPILLTRSGLQNGKRSFQQSSQAYGGSAHTIFRFRPLLEAYEFLLDFGPLSALLNFGPLSASFGFWQVVGPFGFWPIVSPLGFWPVVGLFWILAHCRPFWISARCRPSWILARCRPLLDFGPLSALLDFGPLSALFWISARRQPLLEFGPLSAHLNLHSAATYHRCWPLANLLSSLAVSTIYGPFPASATAVIIISDCKLKVAEYFTLSLRGDVRI